jgi:hypothetical protein
MITYRFMILGAVLGFSANSVYAGPCNTASHDAGSANVPGYTRQTTGTAAIKSKQHPPTSSMSRASEHTSSEDAQAPDAEPAYRCRAIHNHPARTSAQSPDRIAGAVEQTRPAPTEQSKKSTAGAAEPAPSQKRATDC